MTISHLRKGSYIRISEIIPIHIAEYVKRINIVKNILF